MKFLSETMLSKQTSQRTCATTHITYNNPCMICLYVRRLYEIEPLSTCPTQLDICL